MTVKLKIAAGILFGLCFLWLPCMLHAWTEPTYPSIKPWPSGTPGVGPYRPVVRQWRWRWLNWWYMNTEDDLSGDGAWIWVDGVLVPYDSQFPPGTARWKIAYAWSAWRNNVNNLKRPLRTDDLNKAWVA